MSKDKQPTQNQKRKTAEYIIQKAHQLFMEKGFSGVSTRIIAKECGITQPALYHHFANKVSIYVAVVIHDLARTEEAIKKVIASCDTFRDALFEVTVYILNNRPRNLGQMTSDLRQHLEMEEQMRIRQHWVDAYQAPIMGLLEQITIHPTLLQENYLSKLAHVYLGLVHQQLPEMNRLNSQNENELRERAEFLVTVYIDGIHQKSE